MAQWTDTWFVAAVDTVLLAQEIETATGLKLMGDGANPRPVGAIQTRASVISPGNYDVIIVVYSGVPLSSTQQSLHDTILAHAPP